MVYEMLPRKQAKAHYYGDAEELESMKFIAYYAPSSVTIFFAC